MRGKPKSLKPLALSGKVFLDYVDQEAINKASLGDVRLFLNDEELLYSLIENNYQEKGFKGYFKAKIFDGTKWCFLDNQDFFADRINQFSKTDICYYTYLILKERMIEYQGEQVFRTYREHYSLEFIKSNEFKGKKSK